MPRGFDAGDGETQVGLVTSRKRNDLPTAGERANVNKTRHGIIMRLTVCIVATACLAAASATGQGRATFERLYGQHCAVCHGDRFQGTAQGTPLLGAPLIRGEGVEAVAKSIAEGAADRGMPAWAETLSETQIRSLAILIAEERANATFADFRMAPPLELPEVTVETEHHGYRLTKVIDGLEPLPYAIAPLPDGRILLTEKMRGVTVVAPDGTQSELVTGAPVGNRQAFRMGPLQYGLGWILDVALHPNYAENGWIYLSFGDRCTDCGTRPESMIKLVRGRLQGGAWIDEQTIYQADREHYNRASDMAAGGRIAFDHAGHVFLSLGMKGDYHEIQDLGIPHGKVHRFRDDGRVPESNPFAADPGRLASIWTYGHRSVHGLEVNLRTGELWATEMGPRGGDEINLLRPGENYGWPLTSKGVHYNGRPVDGAGLGVDFDPADLVEPVVDFTPSVAVSSFVFYEGEAFSEWRGQMLVGSLKGSDLYRFAMQDGAVAERETVIEDLARIRDIEVGPGGRIFLLLEHEAGSLIVRMDPAEPSAGT